MHDLINSREAEGFGQIEGGSITCENAGVYRIRHTLGGLPRAIEAAAYNQPSSKHEETHTSHLIAEDQVAQFPSDLVQATPPLERANCRKNGGRCLDPSASTEAQGAESCRVSGRLWWY